MGNSGSSPVNVACLFNLKFYKHIQRGLAAKGLPGLGVSKTKRLHGKVYSRYFQTEECPICFEEKVLVKLICDPTRKISHANCAKCIETWLESTDGNFSCSICRTQWSHKSLISELKKLSE